MVKRDTSAFTARNRRLHSLFMRVVEGKYVAQDRRSAQSFLEAIIDRNDPVSCAEKILANPPAIVALRSSIQIDASLAFIQSSIIPLLRYLQAPTLRNVCGGGFLRDILELIVNPPIFWKVFVKAHMSGQLNEEATQCFAWLLLGLLDVQSSVSPEHLAVAGDDLVLTPILLSDKLETRTTGQRIKHILQTIVNSESALLSKDQDGPGGRHDNDFVDFRQITILPTADEVCSTQRPFLRPARDVEDCSDSSKPSTYMDNLFRLYREDFLQEVRDDTQIVIGAKRSKRKATRITGLAAIGISAMTGKRRHDWTLNLQCAQDLPQLRSLKPSKRRDFLENNFRLVKDGSLACLLAGDQILSLVLLHRDLDLLVKKPPVIGVRILGDENIRRTLLRVRESNDITLVQLNTAFFAYKDVLSRLQSIKEIPLQDEILYWQHGMTLQSPPCSNLDGIEILISRLRNHPHDNLRRSLGLPKDTRLDKSQAACLTAALMQRVSLIQGPPGTGKSFIGALATKVLHEFTTEKILIVCYTNHALDQFIQDIQNVGVPRQSIVRLGSMSKADANAKDLLLSQYSRSNGSLGRDSWNLVNERELMADEEKEALDKVIKQFLKSRITVTDVLDHIEFNQCDEEYFEAFTVPVEGDNFQRVGKNGKEIDRAYLIERWCRNGNAGIFPKVAAEHNAVWKKDQSARSVTIERWKTEIWKEQLDAICTMGERHNNHLDSVRSLMGQRDSSVLHEKRIIASTTSAAAKFSVLIQGACPGTVLVEEAGEILESHLITAMGSSTKQLILIGDHKQLRPKASYHLSVDKGDGYDLNRSLFERLVLKGYPHQVLSEQHRMRPEISKLVRNLTYPDLTDGPRTLGRPCLRGFSDNLVFLNHDHPEDDTADEPDWAAMTSRSSKQNTFEVEMVLKCVRYLGQQGYGTDDVVVLTPYLGQLALLIKVLGQDNDPVLSDMDSYDLVQAGLMSAETAKLSKKKIAISTIDNYQGQESNVVVISLTRSNPSNDIGFLSSPERLNVALSRARDGLIIVGNSHTFLHSRQGKGLWGRFLDLLKGGSNIYDGFPVKCERHPSRTVLLKSPDDFDLYCPDGGCREPCGTMLGCGLHTCPSKCHQLHDHSKMLCRKIIKSKCPAGHPLMFQCHEKKASPCKECDRVEQEKTRRLTEELERQKKREAEQRKHDAKMAELDRKIKEIREAQADEQRTAELEAAVQQKMRDLELAKSRREAAAATIQSIMQPEKQHEPSTKPAEGPSPKTQDDMGPVSAEAKTTQPIQLDVSSSEKEWTRQKEQENAVNDALEDLMRMTGLEDVKAQFLRIKSRIETAQRQGTDTKKERFGAVLLGNPGTGKTTVARLYARFLTSVGVLPGSEFIETSGSKLANDGVAEARKQVQGLLKSGGGVMFIDEAYQLTESHNYGGKPVLDYLLAEMENQVGKMVFVLAGYRKNMESFFEHNPGYASRVPYTLSFADYTDKELLHMLLSIIRKKYADNMKIEGGLAGLYTRIMIRRLGRGRGREGFGNARSLENLLSRVSERQADRLQRERVSGLQPDDFLLTKEDVIGPDPTKASLDSTAWKQIQSLIGLDSVKRSIQSMIDRIQVNYRRELKEKEPVQTGLNKVFLGSPGTGKTSVGKLYAQVLVDLGLLSNGEVMIKNPADFVGAHLGESESQTKAILAASVGKVLIIDEAYMLGSGKGVSATGDPFRTAVVDTLVAEVQSTPGEDRCVLLLGYEKELKEMFDNTNPGLARRFPLEDAFHFDDFDDEQLKKILSLKLEQQGLDATCQAKDVAIKVLSKERRRPNFGNGGAVENLITRAKTSQQCRMSKMPLDKRSSDVTFEPEDFDADFDRGSNAVANIRTIFEDVVGSEKIIGQFEGYQRQAMNMTKRGLDPEKYIPFTFVFKGPPGTGKTTTARKIGQIYYDMGFLSKPEVEECSVTDLVGSYLGHTGPKTQGVFRNALGKVLFIDEAYRLQDGGLFGAEAVGELVDCLTKPEFANKLIVILAGYEKDIDSLMSANKGLSSRFATDVHFTDMTPDECFRLLKQLLGRSDLKVIELPHQTSEILAMFEQLSKLESWANGRDVTTLSATIVRTAYESPKANAENSSVEGNLVINALSKMLAERRQRESSHHTPPFAQRLPVQSMNAPPMEPTQTTTNVNTKSQPDKDVFLTPANSSSEESDDEEATTGDEARDPGVSDEMWNVLQRQEKLEILYEKQRQMDQENLDRIRKAMEEEEDLQSIQLREFEQSLLDAKEKEEANEAKRRYEAARLKKLRLLRAREKAEAEAEAFRKQVEEEKKKEKAAQQKLKAMGICPAGFRWVRMNGGYRCTGGSHWISNSQIGI